MYARSICGRGEPAIPMEMDLMPRLFDVVVVGAGHAGCEAAHAVARLGLKAALVTMDLTKIAYMSCNPSIGGPAKGHLTREIDALGGLQGIVTDATYLSIRMLNTGKGASVRALRAQSDRNGYSRKMREVLEAVPNLTLIEGEAAEILETTAPDSNRRITGVRLVCGTELMSPRVVVSPGTFTRAVCFMGERRHNAGRWGETSADALGASLEKAGIGLQRLKTGTSPRIQAKSVDYTKLNPQLSEWRDSAFHNYAPAMRPAWFLPNWLGKTTEETNQLILDNQYSSALYSGAITGAGPRYCPSIEDKVVRFPEARSHPVFIEPDGLDVDLLYLQGLSTSLPLDVQFAFLHTIPGLEQAKIKRPGYAVEYDAVNPLDLDYTFQSKQIGGLYCAGQFNGTSGYEEAAAQGLYAGANAALSLMGKDPLPLTRENSYIGVLVDDLTTMGTTEPYRMLTARAEHRLLLRHDNTLLRLGPIAREWGLLDGAKVEVLEQMHQRVHAVQAELENLKVPIERQERLGIAGKSGQGISGTDAVRRGAGIVDVLPSISRGLSRVLYSTPEAAAGDQFVSRAAMDHVEVEIQYEGYLERARQELARIASQEHRPISPGFDFEAVRTILKATREKLSYARPSTIGQASRVPGVTPADIANLLVAIKRHPGN